MGLGALCLILLCGHIGSYAQSPCSLITPSVLRVDSEETIIVDGQGSEFNAEIIIEDFPRKKLILAKSEVSVNRGNRFFGNVKLRISSVNLERDPNNKQYVYVIVKSEQCSLEKVVLVSFHSGYIFIQTDKPIYTPGSTVLFRIFTMDPNLRPVTRRVVIDFLTPAPDNVIVRKDVIQQTSKTGIMSLTHKLDDLVSFGLWTISAKYEDALIENFTTQFEVKEYVLPSFEIKLTTSQKFFYFNDKKLDVKIEATYLYGKPVKGKAFVLFGVKKNDDKKVLPDTLRSIGISNGEGSTTLKREDLVTYFQQEEDMLGWSLYVSVTVITDSGSDMLESELENIFIVKSPYKILYTKTSKFFKPRMPFNLMVFVTYPDGTPAHRIPVEVKPGNFKGSTRQDGTVLVTLNTESDKEKMQITVSTMDEKLTKEQQASATMEAIAYKPISGNYLHLSVSGDMKPGEVAVVHFNIWNSDPIVQNQINQFNYVIMNKGRIMEVGTQVRQKDQNPVSMLLSITEKFIPSFRILAYYTVTAGARREIVADSVWIDVEDICMGTLEIKGERDTDNAIQNPGGRVSLKLQADHNAAVGLVAVDKGVHVINNKLKISQKKIWDSVEAYDIGCTPGSGANAQGVFYDAGFTLHTSFQMTSPQRTELSCQPTLKRRRRSSALLIQEQDKKASQYTGLEKKCCQDGMHKNPMGHSCDRRSLNIVDGQKCVDAFLDCCRHITHQKERERELKEKDVDSRSVDRSDFLDFADVTTRTFFQESWLWDLKIMNENPDARGVSTKVFNAFLKDSITTWEVLAVSLSESKGICVSQPHNIQVMMKFFIDLKLPYSVVRNEQVEIRAILYNYGNDEIKVRVEWTYNENFCSLSTAKKRYRQDINIEASSSVTAPFVIMPLTLGEHDIEVKAVSQFVSDGVRKKLKVVPEGRRVTEILKSVVLEPSLRGGVQEEQVTIVDFKNIVPDTKVHTTIIIQGTPISELLEKTTDGVNLNHLISAPGGCGEQNMMRMTAPVIATQYLDFSKQWERVGLQRRAQAIEYIKSGIVQQLTFKKPDASYGTWIKTPSSTWLTAYVVKVFSLASKLDNVDKNLICNSVKWLLLNKQNPDGEFREDAPVYQQEIAGGITNKAAERDSTLTAFVLIALLESKESCNDQVGNLPGSIEKAVEYINDHYESLKKPYSIAITSYALAKADKLKDVNKLMSASTDNTYWYESDSRLLSLEATSYALLTLLKLVMTEKTGPLVKWITEQRYYGENYGSTQSTIMQFEALAQYQKDAPGVKDLEMDVSFKLSEKLARKTYRLNLNNALVPRSEETNDPRNFTVIAKGKGQGTLKVFSVYYAIETEKDIKCNNFDLSVTAKDEPDAKRPEDAKSTVSIEICLRYLRKQDATMSIIDISLMTGFAPDTNELDQLKKGVDRYISNFEINKGALDKGALVLYLNKVSHTDMSCLKFNLYQYFQVGLIQPGSVTVYDYYSPERRCTKFYHVDDKSKLLGKICKGEICRCAEENCFLQQQLEEVNALARVNKACEPGVDYAYKLTLNNIEKKENYYVYVMTIKTVIKVGTDVVTVNDKRDFISHAKCNKALNLVVGRDYVVWGVSKDLWHIGSSGYSYMITVNTWIEMWPNEWECQEDAYLDLCEEFENFSDELEIRGCLK
ncbi:complement C3-like isoform X2 [Phyllobates terribilis]|uniref:complement C3-like isoform X2 n=1 Tax=Phyllobates terribilis TaxID=111132 RepID=UPI003CCB0F7D